MDATYAAPSGMANFMDTRLPGNENLTLVEVCFSLTEEAIWSSTLETLLEILSR